LTIETNRKWLRRLVFGAIPVAAIAAVISLWTTVGLTYSRGERVGFVRNLSQRGWTCKTYEGTLAMIAEPAGGAAKLWDFSVRDKGVADRIDSLSGHAVALRYEQYKGVPAACVGETQYFVVGVRQLD
jgi:hypothetical protein